MMLWNEKPTLPYKVKPSYHKVLIRCSVSEARKRLHSVVGTGTIYSGYRKNVCYVEYHCHPYEFNQRLKEAGFKVGDCYGYVVDESKEKEGGIFVPKPYKCSDPHSKLSLKERKEMYRAKRKRRAETKQIKSIIERAESINQNDKEALYRLEVELFALIKLDKYCDYYDDIFFDGELPLPFPFELRWSKKRIEGEYIVFKPRYGNKEEIYISIWEIYNEQFGQTN